MRLVSFSLIVGGMLVWQQAAAQRLSCEMQSMLAGLAATARDQGKSPAQLRAALRKAGDLTNTEIQALIDIAYVHMRNSPPSQVSQAVTLVCKG